MRSISSRRRRKTSATGIPAPARSPNGYDAAFLGARPEAGADRHAQARAIETVRALCAAGSSFAHVERFEETWQEPAAFASPRFDVAMKNYLAARVFANWIAYQGRGLRSIVEWLRTCAAIVRHPTVRRALESHVGAHNAGDSSSGPARDPGDFVEAFRTADLLLLHVVDTQAFAWRVAPLEGPDPR